MAQTYEGLLGKVWPRMNKLLDRADELLAKGETLTPGLVTKLWQELQLQRGYVTQLARFGGQAADQVTAEQRRLIGLAFQHSRAMVDAGLPPGIDNDVLAEAGLSWHQLDPDAVEHLVGSFEQGAPLGDLMSQAGADVPEKVKGALTDGLARGLSPRQVARRIKNVEGIGLTRALAIARTEQLRAYREATRASWQANEGIVKGYRRLAAHDDRTCMACIALDGKLYPTNQPLPSHVSCRCTMVPATVTYKELGLDVPEPKFDNPTAQQWFGKLPEAKQREMMGPAAHDLYKAGTIGLQDFVATKVHPLWGRSEQVGTLDQMTGKKPRGPKEPKGPRPPKPKKPLKPKAPAKAAPPPEFKPDVLSVAAEDLTEKAQKFLEAAPGLGPSAVKADIQQRLTDRLLKDPQAIAAWRKHGPRIDMRLNTVLQTDGEFHAAVLADPTGRMALGESVSALISQWAATSADSYKGALAMQESARKEFPWIKAQRSVFKATTGRERAGRTADTAEVLKQSGPFYQRFLRHMYENTQEELRAAGINEVAVVRGMKLRSTPAWLKGAQEGGVAKVPLQPMSSFSTSFVAASGFTGGKGVIVGATVDARWIIGTARTGFGCLNEQEYVLLAGPGNMQVRNLMMGR